ncbi:hypothetical protein GP486_004184 [Trichoglossum hirsutum]|uniref:Uncharacterized protein n=1 Tax=Trichoglossum hirsutum TaxID=265104 RepID=A0A9P8RPI2_9PEZI|nr:hypothetical protein GP486_004184 [Trichoglossum hirsutum]
MPHVPLDPAKLLSLFSSTSLSCNSQNALVTFNGHAGRQGVVQSSAVGSATVTNAPKRRTNPTPSSILTTPNSGSIITNDGLTLPTATPSAPSAASANGSKSLVVSENALDFARITVLFILQEKNSLDAAVTAQDRLQTAFSSDRSSSNVDVGNGITVKFSCNIIDLGGGKRIGSSKDLC